MEPSVLHQLAASAMDGVGLTRRGRSRWLAESDDLIWVAELDRSGARPWLMLFAAMVREWAPSPGMSPHCSDGHYSQHYPAHGSGVPTSAAQYRWDDHASYFTACFDHRHDLVDEVERQRAFAYMAEDLAGLFRAVSSTSALIEAVREDRLARGAVHRLLDGRVGRG